jgi:hypothetical protein
VEHQIPVFFAQAVDDRPRGVGDVNPVSHDPGP